MALGAAVGAVARYGVGEWWPGSPTFPWATFAINVLGCLLLALLPVLAVVRRRPLLPVFLGTGVLGGFTTLSTYSEQTRALAEAGHGGQAAAYAVGTLAACLVAVLLVDRLDTARQRADFEEAEGDE